MVQYTAWGQQDGSAYKIPCGHTWQLEFVLQDPHSGRKELTSNELSSDLSTHAMATAQTHMQ